MKAFLQTVDWGPTIGLLVSLLATFLTALVGYACRRIAKLAGANADSAATTAAVAQLDQAVSIAAGLATNILTAAVGGWEHGATLRSALVTALGHVYETSTGSVMKLGWTPAHVQAAIEAKVGRQLGSPMRLLGRRPIRDGLFDRLPELGKVMKTLAPPPAAYTDLLDKVPSWILGANDRFGDCTCVAVANIILALTALAGAPVRLTDDTILAFYGLFGFCPTDPSTDNGARIEDVIKTWMTRGIMGPNGVDKLDGGAWINPKDRVRLMQAIAHLGPVDLGIDLPNGWMQASTWSLSTAGTGIAGGHCVTAIGYTAAGLLIVSWGQVFTLEWGAVDVYVVEAHILLSRDRMAASGKDVASVDWEGLETEWKSLVANDSDLEVPGAA